MTETKASWKPYIGPISMTRGLNPFFRGIVALLKNSGEDDDVAVILDANEDVRDHQANARLIAAAPELLDACIAGLKEVAFDARHDPNLDATVKLMRDAIAKATS